MEQFKADVFDRLAKLYPNKPLSTAEIAAVERRLNGAFPAFGTPTHPTYCSMIESAITGLNEKDGSREDAISEYILANYKGLPWAHKRFLSYYLEKLCMTGEIVCTSGKCFTLPGFSPLNSKKQDLKPKSQKKREVCSVGDGKLVGREENANEVSSSQVGTQMLETSGLIRRRSELAVFDDREEVDGVEIFERHDTMIELKGGNEINKKDTMLQHQFFFTTDELHKGLSVAQISPMTQFIESNSEEIRPKKIDNVVSTKDLALDCDPSEKNTEPQLQLASRMEKTLPGVYEDYVRIEALLLDHECRGACLRPMSFESIKKSTVVTIEGNHVGPLLSRVDGDASKYALDKLVSDGRDHSCYAGGLMILPFEGSPKLVEKREIVCGLACMVLEQEKQRHHAYRTRKRSNNLQGGPLLMTAELMSASPIITDCTKLANHEKLCGGFPQYDLPIKSSSFELPLQSRQSDISSQGRNLVMSVGDTSNEHELGIQKFHSESLPSSGKWELVLKEDGDFNVPSQQVIEKYGKQRKFSVQGKERKAQSAWFASSISGAMLQTGLPVSENPAKMSQKGGQMSHQKIYQSQERQGQQQGCVIEAVAAPDAPTFPPFHLEGGSNKCLEEHEGQTLQIAYPVAGISLGKLATKNQHQQGGEGQDPGSFAFVDSANTLPLDDQHHELGVNQQVQEDHGQCHKPDQLTKGNVGELSLTENKNGQEENLEPQNQHHLLQEMPSGPTNDLVVEAASIISNLNLVKIQDRKPASLSHHDQLEVELKQNECEVLLHNTEAITVEGNVANSDQHCLGLNKELKIERRGRPRKHKEEHKDAAASLNLNYLESEGLFASTLLQQSGPQNKWRKKRCGRPKKQKEAIVGAVPQYLHDQRHESLQTTVSHQPYKKVGQGSPKKQKEETVKDVAASLDLYVLQQKGLSEMGGYQGTGEQIETTTVAGLLNLHDQQEERLSEPATCNSKKKDGRGRPRKQKERISIDATVLVAVQQEESSQLATCQPEHSDVRVRTRSQKLVLCELATTTEELAVPNMHGHHQALSELATGHVKKKDNQGRPRKLYKVAAEDLIAAQGLQDQPQEKHCETATYQRKKKDGRGRPRKQTAANIKDATSGLHMQIQQLKEPLLSNLNHRQIDTELVTYPSQEKDSQGMLRKKRKATTEEMEAALSLHARISLPEKKDARGRPGKQTEAPSEDLVTELKLDVQQKGTSEPVTKRDHRGRPRKSEVLKEYPWIFNNEQQEWPCKSAVQSIGTPSSVISDPGEKIWQQQIVTCPDSKLSASSEQPVSLRTRSSLQQLRQKQGELGGAFKPEAPTTFLGSLADHQCQKLHLRGMEEHPNSTPVPELSYEESPQPEMELKPDQQTKQLLSPGEQPWKSQAGVGEVPFEPDQAGKLLYNETSQQLGQKVHGQGPQSELKSGTTPIEKYSHSEEKQGHQLKTLAKVPKQKSIKSESTPVPLSSKNHLRSRSSAQSNAGT